MDLGQRRWPVLSYRLHYTWQPAFKSLKEKVEKDTRSHFIARTGTETCGHLQKKHFYFVCHRSGSYASQATSKQKLKRPSSVKCGKRCFAAMAVTEDNTSVYVVFQFKHRGHDFELGRVFLSKSERAAIADKLREGVSMDAVLDNVRSNVDETFHRINLLSKQDLRKIMRDARVSKTERLHDNDYVSVQLWVERMHSEKENPLLFFKHQGQPDKK
ncbi:zinc finger transcription factor family protein 17-like [Dermacentor andersoni]|uniref:zinc finger transcription factor family protein 17-like n=1 Tax=Dermacentor andersoni TaxID=34620 RepID=UPI0024180C94|nr:zinc finger transcription factor family protein 17-like isoform X1 [Dermacentor andersoni]